MGKVMTRIKLTNSVDLRYAEDGAIPPEAVRQVELEALVDTGATTLAIPADAVAALGLREFARRKVRLASGAVEELPVMVNPASPDMPLLDLLRAS
jgi:predicted aspartyl protease